MPTTSIEFSQRTYEDQGYQARLRRPAWLEGFGFTPVVYRPPAVTTVKPTTLPATIVTAPATEPPPTEYVPSTYQEPPPEVVLEPEPPVTHEEPPVAKRSPWVWVAGGTGAVVIFWLFFRRKRKG